MSSAAAAVTTLKLEPGGKSAFVPRLRSGEAGRQFAWILLTLGMKFGLSARLRSNVGLDAATSTLPVDGSSAKTAPHCVPSAPCAIRWLRGSTVRNTLLPVTVMPCSRSRFVLRTVFRFEFVPVR